MKRLLLIFTALVTVGTAFSQGEKKESGSTLGGLLDRVKDLKVPDSVTNLPSQITDLKESYLETAKSVEDLKIEVGKLRDEVASLRAENAELSKAVGGKVKADSLTDLMKPIEVSASNLVAVYAEDRRSADEQYTDKYLKVIGSIEKFESGTQSIEIFLNADGFDTQVRCTLKRDNSLFVEVLPAQGRLISRNDRRTLLTVGQPVAILGTCKGSRLNVEMINAKIDGLEEKKIEKPEPKN